MNKILILLIFFPLNLHSQNLDVEIMKKVNKIPELNKTLRFISNSEPYIMITIPVSIMGIGLAKHDNDVIKGGAVIALSAVVNLGITTIIKHSVKRRRPFREYPGIIFNNTGKTLNDYSFPSGHTSGSFTAAASLSLLYPKWYVIIPAYLWAATVGYSRVQLGAHYPSDVLAGATLGTGTAYLTFVINKKLKNEIK